MSAGVSHGFCTALAVCFTAVTAYAATVTYSGASGGDWNTAANWDGGVIPQAGDDVVLSKESCVVTLSASTPRLSSLTVSSGTTLIVSNWMTKVEADVIAVSKKGTIKAAGFLYDGMMSNRVWLVGGSLTVAAGGVITADSAGYASLNGPGWAGGTAFNRSPCGVYGGAYGGLEALVVPSPYGSLENPSEPGIGAGRIANDSYNVSGAGGGAIRLDFTGTVVVDGEVTALPSSNAVGSRGSGGAVWISCETISGAGRIDASGGPYWLDTNNNSYFSGGGGRIAVHYNAAAQSNVTCAVEFRALGGAAGTFIKLSQNPEPGVSPLFQAYGRSAEDETPATEHGTLWFTDNQFLFSPAYHAAGMPLGGEWHSGEELGAISWTGPLSFKRTSLKFPSPIDFSVTGDLRIQGTGSYARRNYGLIFTNSNVSVNGTLTLAGARLEMRGGALALNGDCILTNCVNTTRYNGGEIALKAMPTNLPSLYGVTLAVAGTMTMYTNAMIAPFCEPNNGAVAKMTMSNLVMKPGSEINADEKGWRMSTAFPQHSIGSSHGGQGGTISTNSKVLDFYPFATYGDWRHPAAPGQGGGSFHSYAGYDGGGVVLLDVMNVFTFDGVISADGNTRVAGQYAAGSAGGSINVSAATLAGTSGRFRAQGGFCGKSNSQNYGSTGGGGRIAIRTNSAPWSDVDRASRITVAPGGAVDGSDLCSHPNYRAATAGTVYWGKRDKGFIMTFR